MSDDEDVEMKKVPPMAVIDLIEQEKEPKKDVEFKGKTPKAHDRAIVRARFVQNENGPTALVTVGHDALKIWDVRESEKEELELQSFIEVRKWRCGVQQADISADGEDLLIIGTDSLIHKVLINATDSDTHNVITHDLGYMETCFCTIMPGREAFITASFSGFISLVGFDGKIIKKEPFSNLKHISALNCSKSGQFIAVATHDGAIKILDGLTLQERSKCEAHSMKIRAVAFSLDEGCVITGCDDKTIKILDIKGEKPAVLRMLCGHRSPVTTICLDERSDESRMVTGSLHGEILMWNLRSNTPLYKIPSPHETAITSLTFHPNGRHLVSVGEDRAISIYTVPQGNPTSISPILEEPEQPLDVPSQEEDLEQFDESMQDDWNSRYEDEDKENEDKENEEERHDDNGNGDYPTQSVGSAIVGYSDDDNDEET